MIFTSVSSQLEHGLQVQQRSIQRILHISDSLYVLLHKSRFILFDSMFSQCLLTFLYHYIGGKCSTLF